MNEIARPGHDMPWKILDASGRVVNRGEGDASIVEIPEPKS